MRASTASAVDALLVPPGAWPERPWRRWRSWALVLAVFVTDAVAFFASFGVVATSPQELPFPMWLKGIYLTQLVLTPVTAVLLLLRFRLPRLVALLTTVMQFGSAFASLVAFFHLASRRTDRSTVGIGALHVLLSTVVGYAGAGTFAQGLSRWIFAGASAVFSLLMIGILVAVGAYRRSRRDVLTALHERAVRAEREQAAYADHARLQERQLIAREMHDVLAHRISLVTLHAGALVMQADALPSGTPRADRMRRSAELVRENSQLALDELRDVLGVLREDESARLAPPLELNHIPDLLVGWRQTGVSLELHDPAGLTTGHPLDARASRAAARVIRESLTNSVRHSPGGWVRIHLRADGTRLYVSVLNGPATSAGENSTRGTGQGLTGLRERVHLAGGALHAAPTREGGFLVEAVLPTVREASPSPAEITGSTTSSEPSGTPPEAAGLVLEEGAA